MPNLIRPFDEWTLQESPGHAEIVTDQYRSAPDSLRLRFENAGGFGGGVTVGQAESPSFTVTPGATYPVAFYLRADQSQSPLTFLVQHYPAAGTGGGRTTIAQINSTSLAAGWNYFSYEVTPLGSDDAFYCAPQSSGGYVGTIDWHLDVVSYGDPVAVKLAERPVDATVAMLVANLGTELSAIETERGDGLTLTVPASGDYHKSPQEEISGNRVQIEVYEDEFEITDPYVDLGASRAVFDCPLTIRVTYFNESMDSHADMVTRGRRYAAGIYNVFNKNAEMDDSDDATVIGAINAIRPPWVEPGDGDNQFKGCFTVSATVRCEEVQA